MWYNIDMLENILFFTAIIVIYTWPLLLGLFAVWVYRKFVDRDNYYGGNFISGLIMLCASREFFRNFRTIRKR